MLVLLQSVNRSQIAGPHGQMMLNVLGCGAVIEDFPRVKLQRLGRVPIPICY